MMPEHPKTDIKELTKAQLCQWLDRYGIAAYRADQILGWVYQKQADGFEGMTNIGKEIRRLLSGHFTIDRLKTRLMESSKDGSRKYLFQLKDGRFIESVLIPEKDHATLCISSQVGCGQGCRFCLTARGGFQRNLTRGEIVAQVRDVLNKPEPSESGPDKPLTNLVLMGMGEPLANYAPVISALETITDGDLGLKFSPRRVTLSTAGIVPRFSDLGRDTRINLAVSLNATDNETRSRLMPVNRTYPLERLLDACRTYPLNPRDKITIEYILIKGVNDSTENANTLARLLRPVRAKINLIPFNPYDGCEFQKPEPAVVDRFLAILHQHNYTAIIRRSKGADISAACGQLCVRVRP